MNSSLASPATTNGYQVLYRFVGYDSNRLDGSYPLGRLTAVQNRLYGTTLQGGNFNYSACGATKFFSGCGTVFEVTRSGLERVLYRFAGGTDGYSPEAGLLALNGALYGTTYFGGGTPCKRGSGCGIVFVVTLSGQEHVLHSFTGEPDGANPAAALIAVNGVLYGTTEGGGYARKRCRGSGGCGTVYEITPSGHERVIYSFEGGKGGATPSGPLLYHNGALYGTTYSGGSFGCGTVFEVTMPGKERSVYSFQSGSDGCAPHDGVVAVKQILYGVTGFSGDKACRCGTVFSVTPSGTERVIHSFTGGADGRSPVGLVAFKGLLYGTTFQGGNACAYWGCGTVFKTTASGKEQVLYAFKAGTDGVGPDAGLFALRGALYGTTAGGGHYYCQSSNTGCGTVFKILPQ
ncbi:MAG: hypothetical protein JO078_04140 [Candidatus Eremiobacteraeota bacterium]|nr:hypothetical protein [Candidatus Eremiobacteraeota bacterium]